LQDASIFRQQPHSPGLRCELGNQYRPVSVDGWCRFARRFVGFHPFDILRTDISSPTPRR
jgi:hypothetical protein